MRISFLAASLAFAAATAGASGAKQKAHEHGAAKLGLAIDGTAVEIDLDAPAESFFGFEHAPRTDAEKATITSSLKSMREQALMLFAFDADAGCALKDAKIESGQEDAMLGKPAAKPDKHDKHEHKDGGEHADVEALWSFNCKSPLAGGKLRLGLFKAFPRLKRLDVSLVSGAKQSGKTLTKDEALDL